MDNDSVIWGDDEDDDDELHWWPLYEAKSHCMTDNDTYRNQKKKTGKLCVQK